MEPQIPPFSSPATPLFPSKTLNVYCRDQCEGYLDHIDSRKPIMGLRFHFNLMLTAVFVIGLLISGIISYTLLQRQARDEVISEVNLMISAARAIRAYTVNEVRPILADKLTNTFLPQTVPAYAATTTLDRLSKDYKDYKDYSYREATLNPTNPRDRALVWEADLVQQFKRDDSLKRIIGERMAAGERMLYIASPIKISNPACLTCHSTPEAAPASLIARYGNANGFGWQLNEIVAAQVVSVPMSVPVSRANRAFATFIASLATVFLVLYIVLNWMLSRSIVRPITSMAAAADEVSTGNFDIPEFEERKSDEIGRLGLSFNRMRRSLEQAMKMIDE
jgi:protein-histidine pros-kinase